MTGIVPRQSREVMTGAVPNRSDQAHAIRRQPLTPIDDSSLRPDPGRRKVVINRLKPPVLDVMIAPQIRLTHRRMRVISRTVGHLPRDVEATLTVPLEKAYTGGRERIRLEDGRMLEVNLPQAIIGGQKVRLKGQGIAGGDLYLRIDVAPHKFYKLNGLDLMTQVPVTPAEAILAGAIEVPTIDGLVKMNLPRGLKSGQKLRLAQRGYPSPEGDQRGDQIVELVIQVPQDLSEAEKELYDKLTQVETNPRSNLV